MRHSQYTANPLNPPYQGDFEDFAPIEIIGKCILISRVYYNSPSGARCPAYDVGDNLLSTRQNRSKSGKLNSPI